MCELKSVQVYLEISPSYLLPGQRCIGYAQPRSPITYSFPPMTCNITREKVWMANYSLPTSCDGGPVGPQVLLLAPHFFPDTDLRVEGIQTIQLPGYYPVTQGLYTHRSPGTVPSFKVRPELLVDPKPVPSSPSRLHSLRWNPPPRIPVVERE